VSGRQLDLSSREPTAQDNGQPSARWGVGKANCNTTHSLTANRFHILRGVPRGFRKEEEGMGLKTVEGLSVEQAIEMIRTKLGEKMDSRPGNLNRIFQQMDADGSGAIDF
jgi:hypothetical protein